MSKTKSNSVEQIQNWQQLCIHIFHIKRKSLFVTAGKLLLFNTPFRGLLLESRRKDSQFLKEQLLF